MMSEWCASKTQIAPWFLDSKILTIDEFAQFVRMLDDCEHGIVDKKFSATSSYFVMDEKDRLIGATSLRHYLTVEKCGGVLENIVHIENDDELIRRYWIDVGRETLK